MSEAKPLQAILDITDEQERASSGILLQAVIITST